MCGDELGVLAESVGAVDRLRWRRALPDRQTFRSSIANARNVLVANYLPLFAPHLAIVRRPKRASTVLFRDWDAPRIIFSRSIFRSGYHIRYATADLSGGYWRTRGPRV